MNEVILITPPAVEPVLVPEMMLQLGMGTPADSTLNSQLTTFLTSLLLAARQYCENYTRTAFVTQVWQMNCDHWPPVDGRYHVGGAFNASFRLPKPPFQSIAFMQYVDVGGNVQPLIESTDYGSNPNDPIYGYQLDPGADTRPARLLPPWAKPWPPIRRVANAVMVQYKCGFGGPVTASMTASSPILTGPVFNAGDVGQAVSVPGAITGSPPTALITSIASVDSNGEATLAANATAAVTDVAVYVGQPVPESIRQAIKFMTQFFYQNGADVDQPTPRVIESLLEMYRNRVS